MQNKALRGGLLVVLILLGACSNSLSISEQESRQEYFASGIYLLSPDTLREIPSSGFYDRPFVVIPPGNKVRCEKGGLKPTAKSPLMSSFQIYSSVTLRCASFGNGSGLNEQITRSYIIDDSPSIPAIFLTADPNSLFDPDTGIYVEGKEPEGEKVEHWQNYWLDKEIPVFVELMEPGSKEPDFAENAGLKIFGGSSRGLRKKSVAVNFREEYGAKHLHYTLFPDYPELKKFNNFILRNNGNNFRNDYIRDRLASSLSEGLGVDYQRGRHVVVYYNGEYFGIHDLREKSNEHYFQTHYGIKPDEVDLLSTYNHVSAGSSEGYIALTNWLSSNHLQSKANYDYVASQIDVDNYINYMQTEIFADNRDWPGNNVKKWRGTNPITLWRWFLYDLDFGFGYSSQYSNNIFEFVTEENGNSWPNGPRHTLLLRRLLENETFKKAFVNRMVVLLQMNFETSRILARIQEMMGEIESEIPRDQKRWNHSAPRMAWQLDVIKDFARNRPGIVYEEMRKFFSLERTAKVSLSVKGPGVIRVHGLKLDAETMKLKFFEGFPVDVSAAPVEGGVFVGWDDGVKDKNRTIMPEKQASLTALFK